MLGSEGDDEWTQQVDAISGIPYWFNAETGVSLWEKPDPAFWEERFDVYSGRLYYYHTQALVAQWVKPRAFMESRKGESGWVQNMDQASGRAFFYNHKTRASVWAHQAEASASSASR